MRKAIAWPARQIAENAGLDGAVVVGKLLESNFAKAPTARSASCCCSSTTAVRGWPSANRRPKHAPVLGLVVTTVERQLDPSRREHRAGEEPGHPDQAARTQAGDLPAAGAGGVEEVLGDPHVLAHCYRLRPSSPR